MQIREARPEEYEQVGALTFDAYAELGEAGYLGWYGERLRDVAGRAGAGQAQGRGVGRALVDAVVERARVAGKQRVVLHTTDFMPVAQKLYSSFGFVRDESMDFEPEPGTTILGYRFELANTELGGR